MKKKCTGVGKTPSQVSSYSKQDGLCDHCKWIGTLTPSGRIPTHQPVGRTLTHFAKLTRGAF